MFMVDSKGNHEKINIYFVQNKTLFWFWIFVLKDFVRFIGSFFHNYKI